MATYRGNFSGKNDVYAEFSGIYELKYEKFAFQKLSDDLKDWYKNSKILFAWYGYGDYDGSAFVLIERDGKLYEVNGSHCSCFGLEDQWDPEETSVAALRHRINEGYLGKSGYYSEGVFDAVLKRILTRWERKHSK